MSGIGVHDKKFPKNQSTGMFFFFFFFKAVLTRFQRVTKNWIRSHLSNIMVKNLATFYLSPENLIETEFKSNGLIYLQRKFRDCIAFRV